MKKAERWLRKTVFWRQYKPALTSIDNVIYKPLDHAMRQIRVLHVQPGTGGDEVCVTLKTTLADIDSDMTEYEAVSYCWGDATMTSRIRLNNFLFDAPASSVEALRGLRYTKTERVLWIDAICINQFDFTERNHQVAFMGKVYENAIQTNIWLGPTGYELEDAVKVFENLCPLLSEGCRTRSQLNSCDLDDLIASFRDQLEDGRQVLKLRPIYSRPWFTRLWVFQEAMLSSQVVCHIGSHRIAWRDLQLVGALVDEFISKEPGSCEVGKLSDSTSLALPSLFSQTMFQDQAYQPNLLGRLLYMTRNLDVTDPRDRVYALLALTYWFRHDVALPEEIRPDYHAKPRTCFQNAARLIVEEEGLHSLLDVLRGRGIGEDDERWPSWVPQLHRAINTESSSLKYRLRADGMERSDARSTLVPDDLDVLLQTGYLVGPVKDLFPAFHVEADKQENQFHRIAQRYISCIDADLYNRANNPRHIQLLKVLLSTLRTEMHGTYEPNDIPVEDHWPELLAIFLQTVKFDRPSNSVSLAMATRATRDDPDRRVQKMVEEMKSTCGDRKLFFVDTPFRWRIALGPKSLLDGDVVVVIDRCRWPVVLRPTGNSYHLIGECYVHGQWISWKQQEGLCQEVFRII